MGHTIDRFLTVYSYDHKAVGYAHTQAVALFGELVTPIMRSTVNRREGFVVWTSGSKEGLPENQKHLVSLMTFTGLLHVYRTDDDEINPLVWVAVGFGEGDDDHVLLDANRGHTDGERRTESARACVEWGETKGEPFGIYAGLHLDDPRRVTTDDEEDDAVEGPCPTCGVCSECGGPWDAGRTGACSACGRS